MSMINRILLIALLITQVKVFGQITPPGSAPAISSFNLQPDNIGAAQNSVNLFTGDLNLPINLVSIPGKEGLDINVSIAYNSNVQNQVDTWNLDAPAGILGLGWGMDLPKIVCDHKGTGTREDDTYYLVEGGASNKLIRTGSGSDATGSFNTYKTKKYQFWKINFYYDPADYAQGGSGANKWVITRENGMKYVYGDKNSGRSTVQYSVRWGNWIGSSSNTTGQSQMATAWNLSEVNNLWGEKATFEYTNVEQYVGSASGQKHTEASYLKQIVDPIGRKVQFFYNNKSSQFYMEPHTEQPEPDAYQEYYEKQYLDHIDVLQETGAKYLTVNLRYTTINSGNTSKMLLSYIEQRNSANETQPGIRFDYFMSTTTAGYKGFLQKITYPTGGSVSYTYTMTNNTIGHSTRNLNITAPSGYSWPNMWFGPDYVVVAWMLPPSTNCSTRQCDPSPVKLYVYQWVGEWKETYLTTIDNVIGDWENNPSTGNQNDGVTYIDFQVVLENNFFGVLTRPSASANNYNMYLYSKSESVRGGWDLYNNYAPSYDMGAGRPSLISGENFVAIGSHSNVSAYPNRVFTFSGNTFSASTLAVPYPQSSGANSFNYFTSANNYILDFFDTEVISPSVIYDPKITFSFLNEEKKWTSTNVPQIYSGYAGSFYSPSNWYGANSFAVAMAGQNPEYIYRWDLTYSTFTRDNGAGSLFGGWDDNSYVFNIDNSTIGLADYLANGRAARFDGNNWLISPNYLTASSGQIGFGPDYMVACTSSDVTMYSYNPNLSSWVPSSRPSSGAGYFKNVGANFYSDYENHSYYRMPAGSWQNVQQSGADIGGSFAGNCIIAGTTVRFLKNGGTSGLPITIPNCTGGTFDCYKYRTFDQMGRWAFKKLLGSNMIASHNGLIFRLATQINLYYSIGEDITGQQKDYPVASITISGANSTDQNVAFEYTFSSAAIDPTGTVAQYAEVNVIPGSNNPSSKPAGYTKTYFYNGVSNDLRWLGQSYQSNVYDFNSSNNVYSIVSSATSTFGTTGMPIYNSVGALVDFGYYVRPLTTTSTQDGHSITSTNTYRYYNDANNAGLVQTTSVSDGLNTTTVYYTYWSENDNAVKSINLLTPVAQTLKQVNNVTTESQVTRWKNWTASLTGSTVPAVFDQLIWKGNGNGGFTYWDTNSYPSSSLSDWMMTQQVSVRDNATGTPLETLVRGNIPSAVILDQYKIRPIAKIANGCYAQSAFTSFEDSNTLQGNWICADAALTTGSAKTGTRYANVGSTSGIISNSPLTASESYVLSFWGKSSGGTLSITGVGSVTVNSPSTWTYYEFPITGQTSMNLKSTSSTVAIDELRLFPKKAMMTTATYDLVYGATSQTDNNNHVVYTQYDSWGRVQNILDENLNIVKTNTYNTKK